MKRYMAWIVAPLAILATACGDDDGGTDTGTDTATDNGTDTDTGTDTAVDTTPGTSALTGVNTNVSVTAPTRNANCDSTEVDNVPHGALYPWGGLDAAGTEFTCNKCPGGLADFQGMWRAHGFAADDTTPDYSQGADASNDDAESLYIDGNTWYSRFHDQQSNTTTETRGWFFCSQQPEHPNEHLFWVTTDVEDTSGSSKVGDINRSNVILSSGADKKLIEWFDELTGQTYVQIGYCKIGTSSNGQSCNDPYQ